MIQTIPASFLIRNNQIVCFFSSTANWFFRKHFHFQDSGGFLFFFQKSEINQMTSWSAPGFLSPTTPHCSRVSLLAGRDHVWKRGSLRPVTDESGGPPSSFAQPQEGDLQNSRCFDNLRLPVAHTASTATTRPAFGLPAISSLCGLLPVPRIICFADWIQDSTWFPF